jgi:HEAT repeat protein
MPTSIPPENDPSQVPATPYGQPLRQAVSSDELLPPIEPPSAGFIIQLFVIPAVIVAVVVGIWFLIESLARSGEQDPAQIVASLRSSNQARFQQAKELGDMLRLPERYPELKGNRELARKLAEYLDELVRAGDVGDASVAMRIVIARSLGDFSVTEGLPALINAALHDPERDVRRQAINAIAVLAGTTGDAKQPITDEKLSEALITLADDQDKLIRSEAAFALGVSATAPSADAQLAAKLEEMADDPYTDARFNAVTWLARLGNVRAVEGVAEMLDPETIDSSVSGEKAMTPEVTEQALAATRTFKRKVLITNALKAIDDLLAKAALTPEQLSTLEQSLEQFIAALPEMKLPKRPHDELLAGAERRLHQVQARASNP